MGKKKYPKTGVEFIALGDLDELNSLLGIIKGEKRDTCFFHDSKIFETLEFVQQDLFIIQAHVGAFWFENKYKPPDFSHEKVRIIEEHIARLETTLPPCKQFVVAGQNELSAWLDYARAVARRAERSVLAHHAKRSLDPAVLSYLNRLSSLLFVLARAAALRSDKHESHPRYASAIL